MGREDFEIGDGKPEIAAAGGVLLARDERRRAPRSRSSTAPSTWTGRCPRASSRRARAGTRRRCARWRRRPATGASRSPSCPTSPIWTERRGDKLVRYWLMEPIEGGFEPHEEVDELRWVTPDEADELLTYPHDKELVRKALRRYRWRRFTRALMPWSRQPMPACEPAWAGNEPALRWTVEYGQYRPRRKELRRDEQHRDRDPRGRLLLGRRRSCCASATASSRPGSDTPAGRTPNATYGNHRRPRRGRRDRLRSRADLLPGHPRVLLPDPRPDDQGPPGQRHRLAATARRSSTRATSSARSPRTRSPTSTPPACGRARS